MIKQFLRHQIPINKAIFENPKKCADRLDVALSKMRMANWGVQPFKSILHFKSEVRELSDFNQFLHVLIEIPKFCPIPNKKKHDSGFLFGNSCKLKTSLVYKLLILFILLLLRVETIWFKSLIQQIIFRKYWIAVWKFKALSFKYQDYIKSTTSFSTNRFSHSF